ncbi:hypothetical protein DO71_5252 [Burkholderia pseudomallei]|nr:hypothetical protein DO71_5252 [Burkholderia pseudomallei]KGD40222.1 hypothetical protein DO72_4488 [Burkholderia pseudomallei]
MPDRRCHHCKHSRPVGRTNLNPRDGFSSNGAPQPRRRFTVWWQYLHRLKAMRHLELICGVQGNGQVAVEGNTRHLAPVAGMVILVPPRVVRVKVCLIQSRCQ